MQQHITEADLMLTQLRLTLSKIEKALTALMDSHYLEKDIFLSLFNVQQSSMWLGKAKGALGIKSPYPDSFNPENTKIENRADVADSDGAFKLNLNGPTEVLTPLDDIIKEIKSLRKELNVVEGQLSATMGTLTDQQRFQLCITNAFTYCCNGTMWLGMALNTLKSQQPEPKEEVAPTPAEGPILETPIIPPAPEQTDTNIPQSETPVIPMDPSPEVIPPVITDEAPVVPEPAPPVEQEAPAKKKKG